MDEREMFNDDYEKIEEMDENFTPEEFAKMCLDKFNELTGVLNIVNKKNDDILDKDIEELIQKRADAKKNKDFKLADEIRQELLDKGIVLEDTRQGTKWKRV